MTIYNITHSFNILTVSLVGTVNSQSGTVSGTVFDLINSNNTITATEISEHLGMSLRTVKRKIKELKDKGFIERVGSDKTGSWKVFHQKIP